MRLSFHTNRRETKRAAALLSLVGALALGSVGVATAVNSMQPTVASLAAVDAVLGAWTGTLTGDPSLPPEGAPFTMTLELDDAGAITGSFEAGEFVLDVQDAVFSEEDGSFTCRLVTWIENQEVAADLTSAVQNAAMEGSISADGFAADFTASKG